MPDYATDNHWHRGPIRTLEEVRDIMASKGEVMTREGVRRCERRALANFRKEGERLEADARKREESQ